MGTPVKVLVIDPGRGYQRQVEAGETLVDGDGNPLLYPGYGPPVDDIPALKALLPARRVDQQVRLVEDADPNTPGVDYPSNYAWDSSSTDPDDPGSPGRPPAVVLPDDAPATGRWIRVYSEVTSHHEIHEFGGRDEITIENLVTDEYGPGSSSSSPGPSQAIKVLVPDNGGGVVWYDLAIETENHSTDELDPDSILQPDGAGGVAWQQYLIENIPTGELNPAFILQPDGVGGVEWVPYDPVIEGDLDMNCNDITYVNGIYFCDFGSSSSSGSSGPSDLWIRPDADVGRQLQYHADGGHEFDNNILMAEGLWIGTSATDQRIVINNHEILIDDAMMRASYDKTVGISSIIQNTNAGAAAAVSLGVWAWSTGADAFVTCWGHNDGSVSWSFGNDASDGDTFKIHYGPTLVDASLLHLTSAGHLSIVGDMTIGGALSVVGDTTIGGTLAVTADVDMGCNDIVFVDTIYFCEEGSSSSSSAIDDTPTMVWIGPDRATHRGLIYHAADGHEFESPVTMTGLLSMTSNSITGVANLYVDDAGAVGISGNETLVFNAGGNITVSGANLFLGSNGIGNGASVLTFAATGAGLATFGGAITAANYFGATGFTVGITGNELITFNDAGNIAISGANLFLGANGLGNNASILTFVAGVGGAAAFAGDLNVVGHVETDDAYYLGDPDVDGSWRIRRDDWDLVFEHRDSEGWQECDRIPGCASSSSP